MFRTIKLYTPVTPEPVKHKFDCNTVIAGIGSCFADHLLARLFELGLTGQNNPNGIVYNSASICNSIKRVCNETPYTKDDFFEYNGLWHSWQHHGSFSCSALEDSVELAEKSRKSFMKTVKKCRLFIMTPSSSIVYSLKDSGIITANCHKVPQKEFDRKILSHDDNLEYLNLTIELIRNVNPECKIIITLSPVRHYPADLPLNARSKANLLSAIHDCIHKYQDRCIYFPSYEIMNDELRDYRFYGEDMLHPSPLARKIIFERFVNLFFNEGSIQKMKLAEKKLKATNHRPIK